VAFTRNLALSLVASAHFIVCSTSLEFSEISVTDPAAPPLNGIAHVAIRVKDLSASRAFYHKLGFEEAFALDKEGTPTEAFLKVNDTQFIELYPIREAGQDAGFLHVCFESKDIAALNEFYDKRGLQPSPVKRAGAGNLLFTVRGPEQQNIEFTQYMPGSKHSLDLGKHLGTNRISDQIIGVVIPMEDVQKASGFYANEMMFPRVAQQSETVTLRIPGPSEEEIEISPARSNNRLRLIFGIKSLGRASEQMNQNGIAVRGKTNLLIYDPDGNVIQLRLFQSSALSKAP
jgi:catechol 2,3-dioxygenase-like lactoylglutathione lyase family enzyme